MSRVAKKQVQNSAPSAARDEADDEGSQEDEQTPVKEEKKAPPKNFITGPTELHGIMAKFPVFLIVAAASALLIFHCSIFVYASQNMPGLNMVAVIVDFICLILLGGIYVNVVKKSGPSMVWIGALTISFLFHLICVLFVGGTPSYANGFFIQLLSFVAGVLGLWGLSTAYDMINEKPQPEVKDIKK